MGHFVVPGDDDFRFKSLSSQKLLREIKPSTNDNTVTETTPGFNGILVNGVRE